MIGSRMIGKLRAVAWAKMKNRAARGETENQWAADKDLRLRR